MESNDKPFDGNYLFMKYALLFFILVPLISFGQNKKDLKARIYSMQVDSANQAELVDDLQETVSEMEQTIGFQTSTLKEAQNDIASMYSRISELTKNLDAAQEEKDTLLTEVSLLNEELLMVLAVIREKEAIISSLEDELNNLRMEEEVSEENLDSEAYWPPPPTVDSVVISEEKNDAVIHIDTSVVIIKPDIVLGEPQTVGDVIVDVPQQKACFKDADTNCGGLSGTEKDDCCQVAILTYLAKVEYPTQAKNLGVEGKVLLRFVVEKDGSISQIEKVRGDDMLASAAIRHVKNSSGQWIPGSINGENVRSRFVAPFTFKLRNSEQKK
ncbi:MAG: TonB family protein [Chitinophagales bacterium]